jgi:hypothetical protein
VEPSFRIVEKRFLASEERSFPAFMREKERMAFSNAEISGHWKTCFLSVLCASVVSNIRVSVVSHIRTSAVKASLQLQIQAVGYRSGNLPLNDFLPPRTLPFQ